MKTSGGLWFVLIALMALPLTTMAEDLPWFKAIGQVDRTKWHTISAKADVTVSDGKTYSVNTLYHDSQRAVFQRIYPDRTVTHGVEGKYTWGYDGKVESTAPGMMTGIVLGHQIHAQILYFDQLHIVSKLADNASFKGKSVLSAISQTDERDWRFYYAHDGKPLGMVLTPKGQKPIEFVFSDWRPVDGVSMPFAVRIDDGSRQFDYRFQSVRFNHGNLDEYRAPVAQLSDEQKLLRMHRQIMDDHLFGRTDDLSRFTGKAVTIVSGGEVLPGYR